MRFTRAGRRCTKFFISTAVENSDAAEVAPDLLLRDFGGVSPDRRVRIEMRLADLAEIKKRLADHGELLRQAVRWSPATLTSMSTARPAQCPAASRAAGRAR